MLPMAFTPTIMVMTLAFNAFKYAADVQEVLDRLGPPPAVVLPTLAHASVSYIDPAARIVEFAVAAAGPGEGTQFIARETVYGEGAVAHAWAWHPWPLPPSGTPTGSGPFHAVAFPINGPVIRAVVPLQQAGFGNVACVLFGPDTTNATGRVLCWCLFMSSACPFGLQGRNAPSCADYASSPQCYSPDTVPPLPLTGVVDMVASADHHLVAFVLSGPPTDVYVLSTADPTVPWAAHAPHFGTAGTLHKLPPCPGTLAAGGARVRFVHHGGLRLWVATTTGLLEYGPGGWTVLTPEPVAAILPAPGLQTPGEQRNTSRWPGFFDVQGGLHMLAATRGALDDLRCLFPAATVGLPANDFVPIARRLDPWASVVASVEDEGFVFVTRAGALSFYGHAALLNGSYSERRAPEPTCGAHAPGTHCGEAVCMSERQLGLGAAIDAAAPSVLQGTVFQQAAAGLVHLKDGSYWRWGVDIYDYPPVRSQSPSRVLFSVSNGTALTPYTLLVA